MYGYVELIQREFDAAKIPVKVKLRVTDGCRYTGRMEV